MEKNKENTIKEVTNIQPYIVIGNTWLYLDENAEDSLITYGLKSGYSCTTNIRVGGLIRSLKEYDDNQGFISLAEAIERMHVLGKNKQDE